MFQQTLMGQMGNTGIYYEIVVLMIVLMVLLLHWELMKSTCVVLFSFWAALRLDENVQEPPIITGKKRTWFPADLPTNPLIEKGSFTRCFSEVMAMPVTFGDKAMGSCNIPPLDEGVTYTQVSAGLCHTVLLRSDGSAVGCGRNDFGQHDIPPLDEQMSYTQVSAGRMHRVLLRNDGSVACGSNEYGESNIPPLDEGMSYTQISAGADHTVLLRSDGSVVACERNDYGQCDIPPIVDDNGQTVLLRSDGCVVARGRNDDRQCNIPILEPGTFYIGDQM